MMLTSRQSRMTGDADTSLLPVHVHEPALQAAARRTENLQNTQPQEKKKKKKDYLHMQGLDQKHIYECFFFNCEDF